MQGEWNYKLFPFQALTLTATRKTPLLCCHRTPSCGGCHLITNKGKWCAHKQLQLDTAHQTGKSKWREHPEHSRCVLEESEGFNKVLNMCCVFMLHVVKHTTLFGRVKTPPLQIIQSRLSLAGGAPNTTQASKCSVFWGQLRLVCDSVKPNL